MESRNIALQGTLCVSGSATGICVGLGNATVFSRIAKSASGDRPTKTSLEQEISRFVMISERAISIGFHAVQTDDGRSWCSCGVCRIIHRHPLGSVVEEGLSRLHLCTQFAHQLRQCRGRIHPGRYAHRGDMQFNTHRRSHEEEE